MQSVMLAVGLGISPVVSEPMSFDGSTYIVVYLSHLVIYGLIISMSGMFGRPSGLDGITQAYNTVYP